MQWMRRNVNASIRLAVADTREVQGARVMTGLQVNAIALVIAGVATGRLVALWTIAAYPVLMAATYLSYLVRRLRGWNRLWRPDARPARTGDDRQVLTLALMSEQPPALLLGREFEVACVVRDPLGAEYETKDVQLNRGVFSCQYPDMFGKVPGLMPGRYEVTWREEKPVGSGRWRLWDRSRVDVPAWAPVPQVSGSTGP